MNPEINENVDRSMAPPVHDMGPLSLEPESVHTLPNGVTLHLLSGGGVDVCRIKVLLPGGVAESPLPKLFGIANNLMLEGTKSHPGSTLADFIESRGAWTGIENTTHHSGLSLFCLNSTYSFLLPLVKEMIMQPEFSPEAVEKTLRTEASRLEVEERKVLYRAGCALKKIVYGDGHPLTPVGSPSQLLTYTPAQIAEAHAARLDPAGIHIYLSGRITDDMIKITEQEFGSIPSITPFPQPRLIFPEHHEGARIHVDMPDSLQSGVMLMIPAIGRVHADYVPLRMAVITLGGYFGSRLMLNIREEKGLTYGITSSMMGYRHSGFISISSQTDPSTVDLLISETIAEIERMKDPASYTTDEINRLSRFVLSELAGVLDSPFSRMDFLQTKVTASTPSGYFAMQDRVARSLTPDLLATMAETYFDTSRLFIATAGRNN